MQNADNLCKSRQEQREENRRTQEMFAYTKGIWSQYKSLIIRERAESELINKEISKEFKRAMKEILFELKVKEKQNMVPVFKIKAKSLIKEKFPSYIHRLI